MNFPTYLTLSHPTFQLPFTYPLPQPAPQSSQKPGSRAWTKDEVENLFKLSTFYSSLQSRPLSSLKIEDFAVISTYFTQSSFSCMKKIREICVSGTLAHGAWSEAEDVHLIKLISMKIKKWGKIAEMLNRKIHNSDKIRSGKQCKERWVNHLDPSMKRDKWTAEEDLVALRLYRDMGNKWSRIAKIIGNRTDSSVKNRVKSLINRRRQDLGSGISEGEELDRIIERVEVDVKHEVS